MSVDLDIIDDVLTYIVGIKGVNSFHVIFSDTISSKACQMAEIFPHSEVKVALT